MVNKCNHVPSKDKKESQDWNYIKTSRHFRRFAIPFENACLNAEVDDCCNIQDGALCDNSRQMEALNYYHNALHLGCFSSPRSTSMIILLVLFDFFRENRYCVRLYFPNICCFYWIFAVPNNCDSFPFFIGFWNFVFFPF